MRKSQPNHGPVMRPVCAYRFSCVCTDCSSCKTECRNQYKGYEKSDCIYGWESGTRDMASSNMSTIYDLWTTDGGEFVAAVVLLGLVSLVGLLGNTFVISIIASSRRRGQRSNVQLFLLHLAISDLLVCIVCIPLTLWVNFYYPDEDKSGANGVCKLARFVQFLAPSSSICLLTVISIDRYYSLVRPLQAMKTWLRPKILITTAWIYGGAIFLPTFYFAETAKVSTESQSFWYCGTIPNNTLPGFVYLIFLFIFGFGIQLITIIVLYSRVGKAIWIRERKISRTGTVSRANAETMDKTRKRVTRMLLIVVICFLLCWAPFVIYTGFIERWVAPFPNPADPVRVITYAFGLFNSVCNPFIYFFNSPNFRRDSLRKVCLETITSGGVQDHKHNYSGSSSSSTKNSVVSRTDTKVRSRTSTVKNDPAGKLTKQVNISKVSHDNGQGNLERSENVHFSFDNKTFDTKL